MPYELLKSRGKREGYYVVTKATRKKHSKKPLSLERAKAQMRALYAAESGAVMRGGRDVGQNGGLPPVIPPPPPPPPNPQPDPFEEDMMIGGILVELQEDVDTLEDGIEAIENYNLQQLRDFGAFIGNIVMMRRAQVNARLPPQLNEAQRNAILDQFEGYVNDTQTIQLNARNLIRAVAVSCVAALQDVMEQFGAIFPEQEGQQNQPQNQPPPPPPPPPAPPIVGNGRKMRGGDIAWNVDETLDLEGVPTEDKLERAKSMERALRGLTHYFQFRDPVKAFAYRVLADETKEYFDEVEGTLSPEARARNKEVHDDWQNRYARSIVVGTALGLRADPFSPPSKADMPRTRPDTKSDTATLDEKRRIFDKITQSVIDDKSIPDTVKYRTDRATGKPILKKDGNKIIDYANIHRWLGYSNDGLRYSAYGDTLRADYNGIRYGAGKKVDSYGHLPDYYFEY